MDPPLTALASLGDQLELLVTRSEQPGQISFEDSHIEETTDRSERWVILDVIEHSRPDLAFLKRVDVAPVSEGSALHLVGKAAGPVGPDDRGGHAPRNAEVPGSPGHGISWVQPPTGDTAHGTRTQVERQLYVDVEAQIEAEIDGSLDLGFQADMCHVTSHQLAERRLQ